MPLPLEAILNERLFSPPIRYLNVPVLRQSLSFVCSFFHKQLIKVDRAIKKPTDASIFLRGPSHPSSLNRYLLSAYPGTSTATYSRGERAGLANKSSPKEEIH